MRLNMFASFTMTHLVGPESAVPHDAAEAIRCHLPAVDRCGGRRPTTILSRLAGSVDRPSTTSTSHPRVRRMCSCVSRIYFSGMYGVPLCKDCASRHSLAMSRPRRDSRDLDMSNLKALRSGRRNNATGLTVRLPSLSWLVLRVLSARPHPR